MDYIRARIRLSRAMTAFVPALTLSMKLAVGLRDSSGIISAVLASVVAAYVAAFVASQLLERSPAASENVPSAYGR